MNTEDIELILNADSICRQVFQGVFSSDMLPPNPCLLVCNTDPSNKPGRHWIAIHLDDDDGSGEYFDSFGKPPNKHFENYMNKHCRKWIFNQRQLLFVLSALM
jgi:hypothetical protein